jgi:hypothetical protein
MLDLLRDIYGFLVWYWLASMLVGIVFFIFWRISIRRSHHVETRKMKSGGMHNGLG